MRRWKWLGICINILFCPLIIAAQYPVQLGNTSVVIAKWSFGPGKTFIHVHHDETTALKAAKIVARKKGGTVISLIHSGGRNIRFILGHQYYEFDPNRIFTDRGIKKTLKKYGCYSYKAHRAVKRLAIRIKSLLPAGKVIAVHNNKDYSIKVYDKGAESEADAHGLYLSTHQFYRNFFLVTQTHDFERLKDLAWNVVLQTRYPSDDGSLSVYLRRRQYVNVEAGYDQLKKQIEMLKVV